MKKQATLRLILTLCLIAGTTPYAEDTAQASATSQAAEVSAAQTQLSIQSTALQAANATNPSQAANDTNKHLQVNAATLSQGLLTFSETDLHLPGRNGLDLRFVRTYRSSGYRNSPSANILDNKQWAGLFGRGWQGNQNARAYIITPKLIKIERGSGMETYRREHLTDPYFKSGNPDNHNKVYVTLSGTTSDFKNKFESNDSYITGIKLVDTNGNTHTFDLKFFKTKTTDATKSVIRGFWQTHIRNLHQDQITYSYEKLQAFHTITGDLNTLIGRNEPIDSAYRSGSKHLAIYRLKTITDSYDRTLSLHYNQASNLNTNPDEKAQQLSTLRYTNTQGAQSDIRYSYDVSGNLTAVQQGSLPKTEYSYTKYSPAFKQYRWIYKQLNDPGPLEWLSYNIYFFPGYEGDRPYWRTRGKRDDWRAVSDYTFLSGQLLSEVKTGSGGIISYTYEECLAKTERTHTYYLRDKANYYHAQHAKISESYPVLTQKKVKTAAADYVINIRYPRDSNNRISDTKVPYQIPWESDTDAKGYYFPQVTVERPGNLADETYTYQDGLPKTMQKGPIKQETDWDYTSRLKKSVTHYIKNNIQSKTDYTNHDSYRHPRTISHYEADAQGTLRKTRQTHLDYAHDSTLLAQNLIHLPKRSQKIGLISGIAQNRYTRYNSKGQVTDIYDGTSAGGIKLRQIHYDNQGRIASKTRYHAGGSSTTYLSYNESANTIQITETRHNKQRQTILERHTGKVIKTIDVEGQESHYGYDSYGRLISTRYPDGTTKTTHYAADLKRYTETYLNRSTTTYLDELGRIRYIDNPPEIEDLHISYDDSGRVYKRYKGRYPTNWVLIDTSHYDNLGREIRIQDAQWGSSTTAYDDANRSITRQDSTGRQSKTVKDAAGRVIASHYLPSNSKTTYRYNDMGQRTKTIDPKGLHHDREYYGNGWLKRDYRTYKNAAQKTVFADYYYYNTGEVMQKVIRRKTGGSYRTYHFTYDSQGRRYQTRLNSAVVETLRYDESDRDYGKDALTSAENPDAKTTFDYDPYGRLAKESTTVKAVNMRHAIRYTYTDFDAIKTMTFPDGSLLRYVYYASQRLQKIQYEGKDIANFGYNSNDTLQFMTYGNGTVLNYNYEQMNTTATLRREELLWKIEAAPNGNVTAPSYYEHHHYDESGNIVQSDYSHARSKTAASKHFAYDTQDRLSGISLSVPSEGKTYTDYKTYRYDANGNITQYSVSEAKNKVSKPTRTISNEADQLISQIYADRRLDVVYDDEGNITRLTKRYTTGSQAQSTTRYRYNYLGQIQDIEKDGTTIAEYGYASDGLRVYSHTYPNKADTERRPYEGQKVYYYDQQGRNIGEGKPELGHCTVKYIYKGNEKIAMIRPKDVRDRSLGEEIYYFINNAQGTPVRIEDGVGQAVAVPQVDEWGQVSRPGLGSGAEINYTGKKYDPATGLTYFGARYYMPELGVFLTPDPAQQTLNPYLYAGNSPLMFVDPDGEFFFEIFTFVGGAIGGTISGLQKMSGGGSFADGFAEGWVTGAKVGGILGVAADLAAAPFTGGATLATYNEGNPFYIAALSTQAQAWQGKAGSGGSVPIGGDPLPMGGDGKIDLDSRTWTKPLDISPNDFTHPTGGLIRNENSGKGWFRAGRDILGKHSGLDLLGKKVFAPIQGTLDYVSDGGKIKGKIRGKRIDVRLIHMTPIVPNHSFVRKGQHVGNIRPWSVESNVTPHLHIELLYLNNEKWYYLNPQHYFSH